MTLVCINFPTQQTLAETESGEGRGGRIREIFEFNKDNSNYVTTSEEFFLKHRQFLSSIRHFRLL